MIILKRILKKANGRLWSSISASEQGKYIGYCEHGNELFDSIKSRQLHVYKKNYQLLKSSA
jgi:hypothetical protein